jgi:hypothetical protein
LAFAIAYALATHFKAELVGFFAGPTVSPPPASSR